MGVLSPGVTCEQLHAGPLTFLFESNRLRSIGTTGGELVRRVYPAIRDEFWNTIPGEISNLSVEKTSDSCRIAFDSRHRRGLLDFLWHGTVIGSPLGEIVFTMEGSALASFKRKRIGFCVLHAASLCKGMPCSVEHGDGTTTPEIFPLLIAPWQTFTDMRSMTWKTTDGQSAQIRFSGEIFETEDQRNWTDASFKTYGPTIKNAGPELIEKGTVARQTVTIALVQSVSGSAWRSADRLRLDFRAGRVTGMQPLLGFTAAAPAGRRALPERPEDKRIDTFLQSLRFAHARIDIRPYGQGIDEAVRQAASIAIRQSAPVECAIHFTENAVAEAMAVAEAFKIHPLSVVQFLLYHAGGPDIPEPLQVACADLLRAAFPQAELYAGTDGYFVEVNRARPPLDPVDGLCWSATPQVHTFDEPAIMENLPGLLDMLASAHAMAPGKKLAISPLTLRPRKKPSLPLKDGGPDERRGSLFAASWMLGSYAYCIEGGLDRLTLGVLSGEDGIVSDGADIFPSGILASWLLQAEGHPAQCRFSTDPGRIVGLEFANEKSFVGIAANVTGETVAVTFTGTHGCRYSILDDETFERVRATEDPVAAMPELEVQNGQSSITIELSPYSIVRFSGNL
jgi:hypothetical protein